MTPWKSNSAGVPFSLLATLNDCANFDLSAAVNLVNSEWVLGDS